MKNAAFLFISISLLLTVAACGRSIGARTEFAADTAHHQLPIHGLIPAGEFQLASYARVSEPGATARIYIEGDGLAWLGNREPSLNPTPTDPIALKLAARDHAPNVIWLARPCQYEGFSKDCSMEYWTAKRFAPEVIDAYVQALDHLKQQYHFTGFELVGFSGGGAIAALVAANRSDVTNLRTVAGNLDHNLFNALHHVAPMPSSLNPSDYAQKLAHLPQLHVTGGQDTVMPAAVYDSYAKAAGNSGCLHHTVVDGATHEDGWQDAWPQLVAQPLTCDP